MPTPELPARPVAGAISRRGVVRTAAWSVPVISLASAAPAFAGSPQGPEPSGLHFLRIGSWTASAQEAEDNPGAALFPGDGLIVGAYLVYIPVGEGAPALAFPTITIRLPMWTGAEGLAIPGDWTDLGGVGVWEQIKPAADGPAPFVSSDGELVLSFPGGLAPWVVTGVLAQMDTTDYLTNGDAATVNSRVTPEDSDFVAKGVLSYADTSAEAQAWFGSLGPGPGGRMAQRPMWGGVGAR